MPGAVAVIGALVDRAEWRWMQHRRHGTPDGTRVVAGIRVRELGRGSPTIVLAADPPNVIEHLAEVAEALAERHRVVCIEMPGFGYSSPDASLGRMLGELDAAPYALALPCVAGLISATLAAEYPTLVSHVIGVQSPGLASVQAWAARVDRRGLIRTRGLGQAMVALTRRRLARGWYDVAVADPARRPKYLAGALAAFDAGATYPLASALQSFAQLAPPPPIAQPTLLVWGARDPTHRKTPRDGLAPGARVVELASAGHFPELEDVAGFVAAVTAFLK
ncbi:MAG TPA: alpha/beta fold hydrolase [Kofleriaceae bacterium]|nr:alpha/beta fold hydrolase [Kofleriaceae bacterium]